ncbi:ferrous iron transport protein A [Acidobacteria bacterium AH-259-O06]|nr:ferrous iron transport protein A [Acidobacteria bacterium AH-259-O06]
MVQLAELKNGREARVVALDPSCRGLIRRRLLDLGLTPGARVQGELNNVFADPRAYRVRGTLIALRKEQARQIWVETLP